MNRTNRSLSFSIRARHSGERTLHACWPWRLPIANFFSLTFNRPSPISGNRFGEAAEISTRVACAPKNPFDATSLSNT
jgi:hypothetical protein